MVDASDASCSGTFSGSSAPALEGNATASFEMCKSCLLLRRREALAGNSALSHEYQGSLCTLAYYNHMHAHVENLLQDRTACASLAGAAAQVVQLRPKNVLKLAGVVSLVLVERLT